MHAGSGDSTSVLDVVDAWVAMDPPASPPPLPPQMMMMSDKWRQVLEDSRGRQMDGLKNADCAPMSRSQDSYHGVSDRYHHHHEGVDHQERMSLKASAPLLQLEQPRSAIDDAGSNCSLFAGLLSCDPLDTPSFLPLPPPPFLGSACRSSPANGGATVNREVEEEDFKGKTFNDGRVVHGEQHFALPGGIVGHRSIRRQDEEDLEEERIGNPQGRTCSSCVSSSADQPPLEGFRNGKGRIQNCAKPGILPQSFIEKKKKMEKIGTQAGEDGTKDNHDYDGVGDPHECRVGLFQSDDKKKRDHDRWKIMAAEMALAEEEEAEDVVEVMSVSEPSGCQGGAAMMAMLGGGGRSCSNELCRQARLSGPIIAMNLLWQCRFSIATLFLGRLGTIDLAGGSLALTLATLTGYCVLSGMSVGIEILSGKAYGAGKFRELSLTLQRGFLLLLAVCFSTLCVWYVLPAVLLASGQHPKVVSVTAKFLTFLMPDFFVCAGVSALGAYLRSQSITRPSMLSSGLSLMVQAVAGWVLVHVLELGVAGVAVSLFMADMTILLSLLLVTSLFYRSSWTGFSRESFSNLRPLLSLSLPACFAISLDWWCYELMTVASGLLTNPAVSVASMALASNISCLFFMVPSGMYLASSIRMTNELGAHRPDRARLSAKVGSLLAMVGGVVGLCTMLFSRGRWTPLFTGETDIIRMVDGALPFVGMCSLIESPTAMAGAIARCTGRQTVAAITVMPAHGVGLTVGLILAIRTSLGIKGLWLGLVLSQACHFVLLWLFALRSINWEMAAGVGDVKSPAAIARARGGKRERTHSPRSQRREGNITETRGRSKKMAMDALRLPSPRERSDTLSARVGSLDDTHARAPTKALLSISDPSLTESLLRQGSILDRT